MTKESIATILFCKEPKPGQGKQRLAAELGTHEAYLVASHLLRCALEDLFSLPTTPFISPSSETSKPWAESLLPAEISHQAVYPQPEGTLGHRLKSVDDAIRAVGFQKTIHMGSDCPAMSPAHYGEAIALLDRCDIVLTPAADGGVTLMAASTPWPEMEHLPWGTEKLGAALEELCLSQGLSVGKTTPSYDIDIKADLLRLRDEMQSDTREERKLFYHHLSTVL